MHIRWMIRRDLPAVLDIEQASFEFPWGEDDFLRCLGNPNAIGMVVERDERVVGFMVYELHKTRLHVLNIAVHPDFRRQRVGAAMLAKLVVKLSLARRTRIALEVRETNLAAQLWLARQGFRWRITLHDFYDDWQTTEDAYFFEYVLTEEQRGQTTALDPARR